MLRILHTSDWHFGHVLYGYDRTEEQLETLAAIDAICRRERPDALIVSGDLYDVAQPSSAVQRRLTDALIAMRRHNPSMEIIITAGNHDSATRHEIARNLWEEHRIHMVGTVPQREDADLTSLLVRLGDKGVVCAVPYVNRRFVDEDFYVRVTEEASHIETDESLPVVLMAHMAVSGGDYEGHRSMAEGAIIGNLETAPLESLGHDYDYLALGHIHKRQQLDAAGRVCYSGSPMAVSFDEPYAHGVFLVEIECRGAVPRVKSVDLEARCPLLTVGAPAGLSWADALNELNSLEASPGSYVRLNVADDATLPDNAVELARRASAERGLRFCVLNRVRPGRTASEHSETSMTVEELRQRSPLDIARLYADAVGEVFDEDMESLLSEIINEVEEDRRES